MNDRELLEMAAKAAGIALDPDSQNTRYKSKSAFIPNWVYWNPLDDDGDALRLAVKLDISWRRSPWGMGQVITGYLCSMHEFWEPIGSDELAATRRAIVRAAAEIGKAMP